MKWSSALLLCITPLSVFSGSVGEVDIPTTNTTYAFIGGGYYGSDYQSNYTNYFLGALTRKQSFNDTNNSGYGQIGLGVTSHIGSFVFDQQLSLAKLGDSVTFQTGNSNISHWKYSQNIDFGYDWMPKINVYEKLTAYGMLGVHYARFTYQKSTSSETSTRFNNYKDQIGFNLGAGLFYSLCPNLDLGVKYQHWQYSSTQVSGINLASTSIDIQDIKPAFNLIGAELRYRFSA